LCPEPLDGCLPCPHAEPDFTLDAPATSGGQGGHATAEHGLIFLLMDLVIAEVQAIPHWESETKCAMFNVLYKVVQIQNNHQFPFPIVNGITANELIAFLR